MSKHTATPGPWHHDAYTQNVVATVTPDDGGDIICTQPSEGDDSPSRRRWEANARLVAAAPDLLAALEEAKRQLEAYENERTGELYNSLMINAALAKAKGEA